MDRNLPSSASWHLSPSELQVLCHFLWPPLLLLLADHESVCGGAVPKARPPWQSGGSSAVSLEMGLKDLPAVSRKGLEPSLQGREPLNLRAHL